jgi:hypothetical protein
VDEVRALVPEARLSDDVAARRSDVTWDIGERMKLPADRVEIIARAIRAAGARTTQSSVHLHATFDVDDKASGAIAYLSEALHEDAGAVRVRWAFAGDSGNDAACFGAFATTFGVANVAAHVPRLPLPPRYVTSMSMGAGFAEIAHALVEAKKGSPGPGPYEFSELDLFRRPG